MKKILVGTLLSLFSVVLVAGEEPDMTGDMAREADQHTGTVRALIEGSRQKNLADREKSSGTGGEQSVASKVTDFSDSLKDDAEEPYFVGMYREGTKKVAKIYYMGVVGEYKEGHFLPNDSVIQKISATDIDVMKESSGDDAETHYGKMYLTSVQRISEKSIQQNTATYNNHR